MRIFYMGSDIEDLAARGVRQLEIGPGVILTDAARERAEELGVLLVDPVSPSTPKTVPSVQQAAPVATTPVAPLSGKPRGCQHPPLTGVAKPGEPRRVNSDGGGMVDQLIQAVSALKKQGG